MTFGTDLSVKSLPASNLVRSLGRWAVGMVRGGIGQVAKGNYESLSWGFFHELIYRYAGNQGRDLLSRMVARSSWHYLTPERKYFFGHGEFDKQLEGYRLNSESMLSKYIFPYLEPDDRVLEFGCGIGMLARIVAPRCRQYSGVDVSLGAVRAAAHLSRNVPNVSFVVNNGFDLEGVESESMDLVFTHQVIQHLDRTHAFGFFREFFRVLVPGGLVLIHVPILDMQAGVMGFVGQCAELNKRSAHNLPIWRIRYYTSQELKLLLEYLGFEHLSFHQKYRDAYYCLAYKPKRVSTNGSCEAT